MTIYDNVFISKLLFVEIKLLFVTPVK